VNTPTLGGELTLMRTELLGLSFIPQHSDARVLDQLIYKWSEARVMIGKVLTEKYGALLRTGWNLSEKEIARDAAGLLGGNFHEFLRRP